MSKAYTLWCFARYGAVALVELDVLGPGPKEGIIQCRPKVIGVAPLWPEADLKIASKRATAYFTRKHDRPMMIRKEHTRDTVDKALRELGLRESSYLVNFHRKMKGLLHPKIENLKAKLASIDRQLAHYEEACHRVRGLTIDNFVKPGTGGVDPDGADGSVRGELRQGSG